MIASREDRQKKEEVPQTDIGVGNVTQNYCDFKHSVSMYIYFVCNMSS
jgi:hypothetical protein